MHGPPLAHSAAAELAHTKSAYHPFRLPQRTPTPSCLPFPSVAARRGVGAAEPPTSAALHLCQNRCQRRFACCQLIYAASLLAKKRKVTCECGVRLSAVYLGQHRKRAVHHKRMQALS